MLGSYTVEMTYMYINFVLSYSMYVTFVSLYLFSRLTDSLFTAALKASMSILHKTQHVLRNLLLGWSSFQFNSTNCMITWPLEHRDQSTEFKGQWIVGLLERVARVCEELLKTGQ